MGVGIEVEALVRVGGIHRLGPGGLIKNLVSCSLVLSLEFEGRGKRNQEGVFRYLGAES